MKLFLIVLFASISLSHSTKMEIADEAYWNFLEDNIKENSFDYDPISNFKPLINDGLESNGYMNFLNDDLNFLNDDLNFLNDGENGDIFKYDQIMNPIDNTQTLPDHDIFKEPELKKRKSSTLPDDETSTDYVPINNSDALVNDNLESDDYMDFLNDDLKFLNEAENGDTFKYDQSMFPVDNTQTLPDYNINERALKKRKKIPHLDEKISFVNYEEVVVNPKSDPIIMNKAESCICRVDSRNNTNGKIANSIPWMVSLANSNDNHFCGGIIINPIYVLTAAHCVNKKKNENIKVRVGLTDLEDVNIKNKTFLVEKIDLASTKFWNYKPGDIAILKLKTPINFKRSQVEPACLSLKRKNLFDLFMVGYGSTKPLIGNYTAKEFNIGEKSRFLKRISLEQLDKYHKDQIHKNFFENLNQNDFEKKINYYLAYLLFAKSNKKSSPSAGDTGGPIMSKKKKVYLSVDAIISIFPPKIKSGGYFVMGTGEVIGSRLSFHKKWLESYIHDNYCTLNDAR